MSITLSPDSTDRCVFLNCEGSVTPAEITMACRQTLESLAGIESKGVLADVTALQTIPETEQLFDLAKFIWSHFRQIARIALVVRWDQSRPAKLLELLVRTVGVNLTVFVSREQAMAWVLAFSARRHVRLHDSGEASWRTLGASVALESEGQRNCDRTTI
jgi:hypothetical protein